MNAEHFPNERERSGVTSAPVPNRKFSRGLLAVLIVVSTLVIVVISGLVGFTAGYFIGSAESDASASVAGEELETSTEEPDPLDVGYEPIAKDFEVRTSVKEQKCFGSAGCNVTLKIEPVYVGSQIPDENTTWEITYEIRGIEDSPQIDTFTLEDGTFSFQGEQRVSTTTKNAKISTKITSVSVGY